MVGGSAVWGEYGECQDGSARCGEACRAEHVRASMPAWPLWVRVNRWTTGEAGGQRHSGFGGGVGA